MKVEVFDKNGQASGSKVDLKDEIFAAPVNEHAVYLVVKAHRANARQGTHATKTRSMVRGGGKKPWKQKGRGVARAGTNRSPLWVGGGRVFGPEPRDYSQKINKKVKKVARRSVLSSKLAGKALRVIDDFSIDSGKTRDMASVLESFDVRGQKVTVLLGDTDAMLQRASGNLPFVRVLRAETASTYDLLNCQHLLVQKSAISKLEQVLS